MGAGASGLSDQEIEELTKKTTCKSSSVVFGDGCSDESSRAACHVRCLKSQFAIKESNLQGVAVNKKQIKKLRKRFQLLDNRKLGVITM